MKIEHPKYHVIKWEEPWKTSVILWRVHGNEPIGNEVFRTLIKDLKKIDAGTVILVDAHPAAAAKKVREIQTNLNRCFGMPGKTYEHFLANYIIKYFLSKADNLLDLHNMVKNESLIRFLITKHPRLAKYFHVDIAVTGMLETHPGTAVERMLLRGKLAILLEGWSVNNPPMENHDLALESTINWLKYIGNIQGNPEIYSDPKIMHANRKYHNVEPFKLVKPFKDFTPMEAWNLIWYDGNNKVYAKEKGKLIFANDYEEPDSECFSYLVETKTT